MISSADLTLHKLHTIIHQPADGRISQSGSNCVFLRPGNHTLGRIYMSNRSPCCSCCQGSTACIGKKVQDFYRTSCITDLITKPVPVGRLLRKQACVLKAKRFQMESQILIMNIPLLRQIKELPFSAAFLTSVVMTIHMFPAFIRLRCIPDHLRVRTHQKVIPPAFQLLPTGSIDHFIFFPSVCNPHLLSNPPK